MQRHSIFRVFVIGLVFFLFSACGKSPAGTSAKRFTLLPGDATGIGFSNMVPDQAENGLNIIQYLYYYNGGGVAAADLNGDELPDLCFTSNLKENKVYINRGGFRFDSITLPYPLDPQQKWSTGVTYTDANADGRTDIYICQVGNYKGAQGRNLLYINEGNDGAGLPRFTEQAQLYGLDISAFCTQSAFFDYDRDGDLDCFVLCHSVHSAGVYRDTAQTRKYDPLAADRLLRNDNGKYTDVSQSMGIYGGIAGYGLGLSIADVNDDGWPDIYVGNDFHESDYLYINRSGKYFAEVGSKAFGHTSNFTMGTDIADINRDGRLDIISLDMLPPDEYTRKASQPVDQLDIFEYKHQLGYQYQYPRNALQVNLGNNSEGVPIFAEIAQYAAVDATDWSWSPLLADFDLDGQTDLFITNGIRRRGNNLDFLKYSNQTEVQRSATDAEIAQHMPDGKVPNAVFRNLGNYKFEAVAAAWGLDLDGYTTGAAYADFDGDGDLDLAINNINAPACIYRNDTKSDQKRLSIKLEGAQSNPLAIGARLQLSSGHAHTHELMPTRGFQSASELIFQATYPDSITYIQVQVRWPDGEITLHKFEPDSTGHLRLRLRPDDATKASGGQATVTNEQEIWVIRNLPKAKTKTQPVTEKLVPWKSLARHGKTSADFGFVCIPGESPQVFSFSKNSTTPVATSGEVLSGAFADIDGNGEPELIASVLEPTGLSVVRVFRQRQGRWQPDAQPISSADPVAVIAPADADRDGDTDLYLGGGMNRSGYGITPASFLLLNDGKGVFRSVFPETFGNAGMVRDAAWSDLDTNGLPDLVVLGEWMPITIYYQTAAGWRKQELPETNGLWQAIHLHDVNQDGKPDLVAGNFGDNHRLRTTKQSAAWLLSGDLDGNKSPEPVLGYYHAGVPYVLADRDLLATELPVIKKRYPQYDAYARARFEDVFPEAAWTGKSEKRLAYTTSSSLYMNPGNAQMDWQKQSLPPEIDWSSVCSISRTNDGALLFAGNMTAVQPYLGRQDAGMIWWVKQSGQNNWKIKPIQLERKEVRRLFFDKDKVLWVGE